MLLLAAAVLPAPTRQPAGWKAARRFRRRKVDYRTQRLAPRATTSSPWVNSNAWRFIRDPKAQFCIEAPGKLSAVAFAAEAFAYGVDALIRTSGEGVDRVPAHAGLSAGTARSGSVSAREHRHRGRRFRPNRRTHELHSAGAICFYRYQCARPTISLQVNVKSTGADPDPSKQAYAIRQEVGDANRLLRLYGSEVVIGRLTGNNMQVRLHIVNYYAEACGRPPGPYCRTLCKSGIKGLQCS